MDPAGRVEQVSKDEKLTVKRQCELLAVNRSSVYYQPKEPTKEEQQRAEYIRSRLDYWHTEFCWMGSRNLLNKLRQDDKIGGIGRALIRHYMREMGIFAVYPKPDTSKANKQHKKYPYLLRGKRIWLPNQVWAIDITYISLGKTHMYLTAIIDWYSRYIVGWALSDTLETAPVLVALKEAIEKHGIPAIINSDQGSQFTSDDYTGYLQSMGIHQSMDGKARWVDNVIIERWFRSLKTEEIYISCYENPRELRVGIEEYIRKYNYERPHSSLGEERPATVYHGKFALNDNGQQVA
ncbi:MAG: IS3 family transposase [Clostridiaceae bacterium]|nr:IS3 family transposase [Clostridiaceae bacterium]